MKPSLQRLRDRFDISSKIADASGLSKEKVQAARKFAKAGRGHLTFVQSLRGKGYTVDQGFSMLAEHKKTCSKCTSKSEARQIFDEATGD